jgi:hypothetical protein
LAAAKDPRIGDCDGTENWLLCEGTEVGDCEGTDVDCWDGTENWLLGRNRELAAAKDGTEIRLAAAKDGTEN